MTTRVSHTAFKPFFFFFFFVSVAESQEKILNCNMEGTKRISLKKSKRKKKYRRFVRNIVAYLNSDDYLFAPLFSNSESSKENDISMEGKEKKRVKRRMSEKVKEYLNSDTHMYAPIISSVSSLNKGKLQITNLVTMEVSTNTTTSMTEEENNYSNLRSDIGVEQTLLHNGRIKSPKQARVILGGQQSGLSPETDLSPAFSSLPEKKMGKPDQRRVTIE
ncbi:hypothetical protein AALP_AA8G366800 [Arabis alpina]|uniref:Uncharacterized protein n=1 Tax=Arabis alpina TaxID=50452 RepID=A0A087GBR5_ARAAL|nr:hypothetical protein AALP_AA8G366800 [Arabis alpina]